MDFKEKSRIPNPREKANPFSALFFWWMNPLFSKGAQQDLTLDDLYDMLQEDESQKLGNALSKAWNEQLKKTKENPGYRPSLYKALLAMFKTAYLLTVIGLIFDECIVRVAQPLLLKYLIVSFSNGSERWVQYMYAAGICITTLIHMLITHPAMFSLQHIGMKCKIACSSLIYRKSINLSRSAQGKTTVGQMINLVGIDASKFDTTLQYLSYIVIGPIQLAIFGCILWKELEASALAGVGFVVFLIPIQYLIGKLQTRQRFHLAKRTDERGRIMNEIIIAMRVIKMYAWEKPFSEIVHEIRKFEVESLKKIACLRALHISIFVSSIRLATILIFFSYIMTGHPLTADVVFFVLSIFSIVRQVMIFFFPAAIVAIGNLFVSISRIETFLLLENQDQSLNTHYIKAAPIKMNDDKFEATVRMENAESRWNDGRVALWDFNVNLKGDQLVMVVGTVGSGKTSLLHVVLGELPLTKGRCIVNGQTAYASQEPWIFGGSVRQNILFGSEFEEARYNDVVRVCALENDFKQLPHGDLTITGERGVALSGGQKARVNLARCLYQKADIYLLDDPLSAVDSKVSRHIFEKCVKEHLSGYLRILCTHQLQYLPQADHIIVIDEHGKIKAQGTYQKLVGDGIDLISLVTSDSVDGIGRKNSIVKKEETPGKEMNEEVSPEVQEEKMAGGSVTLRTYWEYLKAAETNFGIFMMIIAFISSRLIFLLADVWLTKWTTAEEKRLRKLNSSLSFTQSEVEYDSNEGYLGHKWTPKNNHGYMGEQFYFLVYGGIVIAVFLLNKFRTIYLAIFFIKISINVHNRMFVSLVRAPMKFFDETPSGRVINRYTTDLGAIDEMLPNSFVDAISTFLYMANLVILVIISNFKMAIPSGFLLLGLIYMRGYFIKTARAVKRMEAVSHSPTFTHLAASAQGLATIRAAKRQQILCDQFDCHQNLHASAWYTLISCNRWFAMRLEMLSVAYLFIVTISFLILSTMTPYNSSNVGLAISSALSLTGVFQLAMKHSAETENLMTSAERALEYTKLEPEASLESEPDKKPPTNWPSSGEIRFEDYYLAYEDKDVVKGLTFTIKAQEKIGIVGRTGAGKSSIIAGLFRMTEPRGDLLIDGVRVNDIGLHDLRKSISIIPQDPVLFSGTIRHNLDPFDQFSDGELWRVISEVELKDTVPALDIMVTDGGGNFSVGQRQLVCLGRAILRKNKIIVLDEATANVDPRTDKFIQNTIRTKFADCTIITIAHRLHSVMDCDRILVLDNGYFKEYDHPHVLLQNPNSYLCAMVKHTGKSSENLLRKIAEDTYTGRRNSFQRDNILEIRRSISRSVNGNNNSL